MQQQLLEKLGEWHAKLEAFFDQAFKQSRGQMKCASGCDQCCRVERTVFGIEADLIRAYVATNSLPSKPESEANTCAFLDQGHCTIYHVRPSICRTHGLVLKHGAEISHCDLNFQDELPPKGNWLSSETADTVLATLQIAYERVGGEGRRISLRELWRELTKSAS